MITGKTQSQSQKKYFHPNGVINCLHVKFLKKKIKSIYHKALPIIVSKRESFDIDTESELEIIRRIF